jgi:MFS family permease
LVLTLLVFFAGVTVGLERNVVPVLAEEEFAIASTSVILSFVVSFGVVKALLNLVGGRLSESWGRKPLLLIGWLAAVPIPPLIIWAPNWWWIVAANVFMGVNQGLAWSMTVTSKMDLVGAKWRGSATGVNEFAGYSGVAIGALVTGYLAAAYGLRPVPFYFGLVVILAALGITVGFAKETRHLAQIEADLSGANPVPNGSPDPSSNSVREPSFLHIFKFTTWQDPAMFAVTQAGLVHKFTDALVWVSFPLFFRSHGLGVEQIGLIIGVYGLTWGVLQLGTGPMTDKLGRKWPIVAGLFLCGAGVFLTNVLSGIAN